MTIIKLVGVPGLMPSLCLWSLGDAKTHRLRHASNASWLFSTAASSLKESKLLENQKEVKLRERMERGEELNNAALKGTAGDTVPAQVPPPLPRLP